MSAVISRDILPILRKRTENGHELKTARWAARGAGGGVVAMAIVADYLPGSNNIIDIAQKVVHLGLGPMGALFLVAMLAPYAGTIAANAGLLAGVLAAIGFAFHEVILDKSLLSPLLIIPMSWVVTLVSVLVLGLVFRSGRGPEGSTLDLK